MCTTQTTQTIQDAERTENVTILWNIPDCRPLLLQNKGQYRTSCFSKNKNGSTTYTNYELKIQFSAQQNQEIDIFFLSTKKMIVQSQITIAPDVYGSKNKLYQYRRVEAYKWQYLITDTNTKESILRLKFEFSAKDNLNDSDQTPESQMRLNFGYLLSDGLFSDTVIKSTDGNEFKVHKAILATRSAVFKAHFAHDTEERLTNVLESPFESTVVHSILTFIYTNEAEKIDDIPDKLLAAAEFYQLDKLKELCEDALSNKLTVENSVETLELADLYSLKNLETATLQFISDDSRAHRITETEGWTKLTSTKLIKSLYETVSKNE